MFGKAYIICHNIKPPPETVAMDASKAVAELSPSLDRLSGSHPAAVPDLGHGLGAIGSLFNMFPSNEKKYFFQLG